MIEATDAIKSEVGSREPNVEEGTVIESQRMGGL
jgi:hypothetical protein